MSVPSLQPYSHNILRHIPISHWMVLGTLTLFLTVFLLIRRKCSVYCAICLGITVLMGLFLLDAAVVIRIGSGVHPKTGFSLALEYHRLILGSKARQTEMLANIAAFVPFGFFLSEYQALVKRRDAWRRIGYTVLPAFVLSLSIESLQLIFHIGVFEITDLVLNTMGGFIGAGVAVVFRRFLRSLALCRNDKKEIPSLRSE